MIKLSAIGELCFSIGKLEVEFSAPNIELSIMCIFSVVRSPCERLVYLYIDPHHVVGCPLIKNTCFRIEIELILEFSQAPKQKV